MAVPVFFGVPLGAEEITLESLDTPPLVDVLLLGETHDNPHHHIAQARAITAFQPGSVVFEMLDEDQAALITPETLQDLDALGEVLQWEERGWPDFELYTPVFAALGDARVFGAAVPRADVRAAFSDGAAEAFGPGASFFGLDQPLPEAEQQARNQLQFAAHCEAMPLEMMGGMVEAQRLRDASFARTIMAASKISGPVVAIMGSGHVRTDWGVPSVLTFAAPDLEVVAVALLEAAPDGDTPPPFDAWLVTPAAEREDPCAVFR